MTFDGLIGLGFGVKLVKWGIPELFREGSKSWYGLLIGGSTCECIRCTLSLSMTLNITSGTFLFFLSTISPSRSHVPPFTHSECPPSFYRKNLRQLRTGVMYGSRILRELHSEVQVRRAGTQKHTINYYQQASNRSYP